MARQPQRELGSLSPANWIAEARPDEALLGAARHATDRLAARGPPAPQPTRLNRSISRPGLSPTPYPYARTHAEAHEAEWFCNCREHRFDPPPEASSLFGTCYLAGDPLGAFVEKSGNLPVVTRERVDGRTSSRRAPATDGPSASAATFRVTSPSRSATSRGAAARHAPGTSCWRSSRPPRARPAWSARAPAFAKGRLRPQPRWSEAKVAGVNKWGRARYAPGSASGL